MLLSRKPTSCYQNWFFQKVRPSVTGLASWLVIYTAPNKAARAVFFWHFFNCSIHKVRTCNGLYPNYLHNPCLQHLYRFPPPQSNVLEGTAVLVSSVSVKPENFSLPGRHVVCGMSWPGAEQTCHKAPRNHTVKMHKAGSTFEANGA